MRRKRLRFVIVGCVLFLGLFLSGASLLDSLAAAEAGEPEPADVLGPNDIFTLIVDIDNKGEGSVTYSYEFEE